MTDTLKPYISFLFNLTGESFLIFDVVAMLCLLSGYVKALKKNTWLGLEKKRKIRLENVATSLRKYPAVSRSRMLNGHLENGGLSLGSHLTQLSRHHRPYPHPNMGQLMQGQ